MHDGVRFLRHGALHGCLSRFTKGTSRRLNVENQPLHALSAACIRDGLKNTILVFDLRSLLVANDCRSVRLQRLCVPSGCLQHLGWLDVMNRVHGKWLSKTGLESHLSYSTFVYMQKRRRRNIIW